MKKKIVILLFGSILCFFSCNENEDENEYINAEYFLSEIRPNYFDNMNWELANIRSNIPNYLSNFMEIHDKSELEYNAGMYTSSNDLKYYGFLKQYFSFYLLCVTAGYLDENLTAQEIVGNNTHGLFSGLSTGTDDFMQKELEAMMAEAKKIAYESVYINGYNDLAYGFYLACCQVYKRLQSRVNRNSFDEHLKLIDFSFISLVNYSDIPVWNLMMPQVTMSNYLDSLNTFKNEEMNRLLFNVNARVIPGMLEKEGRYAEMIGPLYKFDLNMKKIDWLIHLDRELNHEDLRLFDNSIEAMDVASNFIEEERSELLNSWMYKETYHERKEKFDLIKKYRRNINSEDKPELESFIASKRFRKAYQCYACHQLQ
ncbi:MAG: hypothetical protein LBQ22_00355 [Bacteroidales bacterium]|jgi:hypothetical protein|nr:hypothetical protein [Bacteroidales bacterium]